MGIGILAGALQGASQAGGQIADEAIKQRDTLALQKAQSDLALERESAIARLQSQLRGDEELRRTDPNSDIGKASLAMRDKTNAQDVAKDTQITQGRLKATSEQSIADSNNPDYLAGVKKTAEAKETDSEKAVRAAQVRASDASAAYARAHAGVAALQRDLLNMDVNDRKTFNKLDDELNSMPLPSKQTPEQQERILQIARQLESLNRRSGRAAPKDPELDVVETEREEIDPNTGAKTKTKEISKRRPGAGPSNQPQDIGAQLRAGLEAVRAGKPAPAAPGPAPTAKPAPGKVETTTAPDGSMRYRMPGQPMWYASEMEARRAAVDAIRKQAEPEPVNTYGAEPF